MEDNTLDLEPDYQNAPSGNPEYGLRHFLENSITPWTPIAHLQEEPQDPVDYGQTFGRYQETDTGPSQGLDFSDDSGDEEDPESSGSGEVGEGGSGGGGYHLPQGPQSLSSQASPEPTGLFGSPTMYKIGKVLNAFGAAYQGQTPLYMQLEQQQARQQQADAILRAKQQQQLEQRNLKEADQAIKVATDPNIPHSVRVKTLESLNTTHARALAPVVTKDFSANAKAYEKHLSPRGKKLLEQWYGDPNSVQMADLESEFNLAKDRYQKTAQSRAESSMVGDLRDRFQAWSQDPTHNPPLTSDELDLLDKAEKEQEKQNLTIAGLKQKYSQEQALFPGKLVEQNAKASESQTKATLDQAARHADLNRRIWEANRSGADIVSAGFPVGPEGEMHHIITSGKTGESREVVGMPVVRTQDVAVKFTPEQAGRVSGMNQALNNIQELRGMLVKDGVVDRNLLFTSAFGGLPFTGGRDVNRYFQDAIETKHRLQTGAAASSKEVEKEMMKFEPKQLDSDATIIGKFDALEKYYLDTFNVLDPSGEVRARLGPNGANVGAPPMPFNQAYDSISKKHPSWSKKEVFQELQRRGIQP